MRIVVVEDEERSRKGISRLIHSIDDSFRVVAQAANGREALEKIRKLRPDVVLTDIKMPVMDGLALIEAAQAENIRPHFVIISAFAEFEYAQKAISFGVQEFIVKPVTYDDVEGMLAKLSRLPRSAEYPPEQSAVHPLVSRMLAEIQENYAGKISLEKLAESMQVTPEYLSRLFSRDVGESFSQYLQKHRVEQGKALLAKGNQKIGDVAASLGFTDEKYFCRVFKKVTGMSPSQYGRQYMG